MKRMDYSGGFRGGRLFVGRGADPADRGTQSPISNVQCPMTNDRRRGVALIIVLGFLTIMILMAIAFLTQARVERLVSDSSLEGMRTRQVAQTAMAAAMQDYLNALLSIPQSDPTHDVFLSGDAPVSLGFYYSGDLIGDDRLLIGKVEDWLLDEHLDAALDGGIPEDGARNAEWIWVRQQPGARSRILGRYAYACFDMSGLLDANLLGTQYGDDVPQYGDRTNRTNVRKMVYEALSQSGGGDGQRKLNLYQRIWKGFDTPAALLHLTDGDWNDGRNSGPNRWLGADMDESLVGGISPSSLSAYSYAALHREDGSGKEKIACVASEIQKDADFDDILAGANQADVIKAMEDYESSDRAPQGVNYPSVKNVPMFNEIGARARLVETPVVGGSTYVLELRLRLEFWYPFPSDDNDISGSFSMAIPSLGGNVSAVGPQNIWVQMAGVLSGGGGYDTTVQAGSVMSVPAALAVPANYNNGLPYYSPSASDGEIVYSVQLQNSGGTIMPAGMQLQINNVKIIAPLVLTAGGPVDSTPTAEPFDISFSGEPPIANGVSTPWKSLGVSDPRLNHLVDAWSIEDPPTWNQVNTSAKGAKDEARAALGYPPGDYFYCRNGPMKCPAELGYLSAGTPWKTLDVFSDKGVSLMNRLIDEDRADFFQTYDVFFTNGTINPYTRHTNVLNAAFYGVDIREVPGIDEEPKNSERLNGNNLKLIVDAMMAAPVKNGYAGWGKILASKNLPQDLNKNKRIAIMNDTWGLFNESDRLFVVAVIAQSIKEGGDPSGLGNWSAVDDVITGERRAVALCWMDGSADVGGSSLARELNVIMFQYLNE